MLVAHFDFRHDARGTAELFGGLRDEFFPVREDQGARGLKVSREPAEEHGLPGTRRQDGELAVELAEPLPDLREGIVLVGAQRHPLRMDWHHCA
jgi:hypothetical protein